MPRRIFSRPGHADNGIGRKDKALADALRAARNDEEADRIARNDGHRNATDAVLWLQERS